MHRDSVDNAVIYMPDDLVLFRESPFAAWMERLTLDNPDHGILPDAGTEAPRQHIENVDDIVATLRAEGRNVAVIDATMTPFERREDTLSAMRNGADFIAGGYLQKDAIAANAGLLMRTSGFSSLGNFLYIPCETRPLDRRNSPFRLCVLAQLLQGVQKQLPPQMLVISGSADLEPLQTEDHIYYYRAVLARFLDAMNGFRKHKMPDPAESAYFGRWGECAGEVLKQRALRGDAPERGHEEPEIIEEIVVELPRAQAAGAPPAAASDESRGLLVAQAAMLAESDAPTLAEQASQLSPGTYRAGAAPGHTPNLARVAPLRPVVREEPEPPVESESMELDIVDEDAPMRRNSDVALENLEFIGSAPGSLLGPEPLLDVAPLSDDAAPAAQDVSRPGPGAQPDHNTGDRRRRQQEALRRGPRAPLPDLEPRDPQLLPPELGGPEPGLTDRSLSEAAAGMRPTAKRHPLDSEPGGRDRFIDMDGAPPPALSPLSPGDDPADEKSVLSSIERLRSSREQETRRGARPISDSLITGEEFEDPDKP